MEFQSDPNLSRLAGVVTGFLGLCTLGMAVPAWGETIAPILALAGLCFVAIGPLAFCARRVAHVEPARGEVSLVTQTLGWRREQEYSLSAFRAVGIVSAGSGVNEGSSRVSYRVQLLGASNVALPGGGTDRAEVVARARELATLTGLELDETPAMGFFNHRL